jgi:hypothetical protein
LLYFKNRLPGLPQNIRLEWKGLTVANGLAYYSIEIIMTVKSFMVHATLGLKVLFEKSSLDESLTALLNFLQS